ncbi:MAG TPA: diguanylate cyclase [Candidatus Acidoferrales bacterium]|jgi:diguanylate cyclase (GGDEF)-like protein|nr:diguanylate cyclase [Candidatus Acidoferrales bacterium]
MIDPFTQAKFESMISGEPMAVPGPTIAPPPEPRILIAEDDPVSLRVLQAFLSKWKYQVVVATDGLEALRILESDDAPSLAILDWMMPGMEGPEICRHVRQLVNRPYVYILLLTARSLKGDLLRGLAFGADDYLTKPFDAMELRARLHVGLRILDLQHNLIAAREELRFKATYDTLTGLCNRGVILEALGREYARRAREGGSFGLILADLDHFKSVNDTYGHMAGDEVLREISRRMRRCVRTYDIVGRYGGEEFLIVVPASDRANSISLAERIRAATAVEPVASDQHRISTTISLGVTVCDGEKSGDVNTLLRCADEALYRAKGLGRNRVEFASSQELSLPAALHDPAAVESK